MKRGVDVSSYQGKIDWENAKNHIDFAIIRCGYGNDLVDQDDREYVRNREECERLGIPFGTYLFSYATNEKMIESEVKHTLRLIKNVKLEYPVFIDIEYREQLALPKDKLVELVELYCQKIEDAGYYVGIYASLNTFLTKLNDERLNRFDKWVAEWNKDFTYKESAGMWQNENSGRIPGIETRVDEDRAFYDYPTIIREAGLNNLGQDNKELKYKKGDRLTLNGTLYKDEDGKEEIKKYRNKKVKVVDTSTNKNSRAPYKLDLGGYSKEEDLKEIENDVCFVMKLVNYILNLFKKKKN